MQSVYNAPPDLTSSDDEFGNGATLDRDSECARVTSITRDDDAGVFRIRVALKLGGRGCNKTIPWTVAPRLHNQVVSGEDALSRCDTSTGGCARIDAGPLRGLSIAAPPPVYRAPLTAPLNSLSDRSVPFGYTGYQVYETESKGTCGKYGFTGLNTGQAASYRKAGPLGVALATPRENECNGTVPQQSAFTSQYTPKIASNRLSAYLNMPKGDGQNRTVQNDVFAELLINNTAYATGRRSMPFGYVNVAELLGVVDPFACGSNLTSGEGTYKIGSSPQETHSCPMTITEWEAVLPDVVIAGGNVDDVIGPNSTAYDAFQRDGAWIVPSDTLGTLPMVCYRCSSVESDDVDGSSRAANYASRHMPISMSFGPQCAGLTVRNSRQSTRVALGVFVGISSTADAFDGEWQSSASFPVRYARAIGDTRRQSSVGAPGSTPGTLLNASLRWTKNTDGSALRFEMSALRYILCNGGGAAVMTAGINKTSGAHIGPLVSRMWNSSNSAVDRGPVWPNPYRWIALDGMPDCAGCTFPTVSTQKGWTVMDSQVWHYGQHGGVGGYHADHSLWSRILALVNGTDGLHPDGDFNLFAKWNEPTQFTNLYAEAARALNQSDVLPGIIEKLSTFGIPGIGPYSWAMSACDFMHHAGRPRPGGQHVRISQGTTATPLCWLLRRQLYAQSQARVQRNLNMASTTSSMPDLASAQRTGIYNSLAPNVWFGAWQRRPEDGDTQWQVFMDDTWDRTGRSVFGEGGMARDAEGEMTFEVPIASVERNDGPTVFEYVADGSKCGGVPLFSAIDQRFHASITFMSPTSTVTGLTATFTPYNCRGSIDYNISGVVVQSEPLSIHMYSATLGDPDPETAQRPIVLTIPYDTVGLNVSYSISFPFTCHARVNQAEEFGFFGDVSYTQFNTPTSSDENELTGEISLTLCSRRSDTFEGPLANARAFDMSSLAPNEDDDLPVGYVCGIVFLDNPLKGGFHFSDEDNTTVVFDDDARKFVQYNCLSYASSIDPDFQAACNVSASTGKRTGNCHYIEDLYYPTCTQFWKLSCTPWNDGQFGFAVFVLFVGGIVIALLTLLLIRMTRTKDRQKDQDEATQRALNSAYRSRDVISRPKLRALRSQRARTPQ